MDSKRRGVKQGVRGWRAGKDEPYQSFARNGRICKCRAASVTFDPGSLRLKK